VNHVPGFRSDKGRRAAPNLLFFNDKSTHGFFGAPRLLEVRMFTSQDPNHIGGPGNIILVYAGSRAVFKGKIG